MVSPGDMLGDMLACAHMLLAKRDVDQALALFLQAEKAGADADACTAGRWECSMLLGRYEDAWAASDAMEARQRATGIADPLRFWDGAPLAGKRVMLRGLHGFGDTLQFIRYAPLLRSQAASLCVETHPELVDLLGACDGVEQVIPWGHGAPEKPPAWDAQIEIMELPSIFRSTTATIPATDAYLQSSRLVYRPAACALARRIEQRRRDTRLHFGLSWRSSNWNPLRSLPLPLLADALADLTCCQGYSLQQGGAAELEGVHNMAIENIEAPFAELAVRLSFLDVVVTVDGVLAHLAGALGKPVLLLLPYAADWRWGLGGSTPWYPRTRIFRQQRPGDWSHPLEQARVALRHLISP